MGRSALRSHLPVLGVASVLALFVSNSLAATDRIAAKRLFAPPEAVLDGSLRLPSPAEGAVASKTSMVRLSRPGEPAVFMHGGGPIRVLPLAAAGVEGRIMVTREGDPATVAVPVGPVTWDAVPIGWTSVPLDPLGIPAETSLAEWVSEKGRQSIRFEGDPGAPVLVAIGDSSEVALVAARATPLVREGEPLVVRVEARRPAMSPPLADLTFAKRALAGTALPFSIDRAEVRFADGTVAEGGPSPGPDGTSLVAFPSTVAGDAVVEISGSVRDGRVLRSRQVTLLTRIARSGTQLAGEPSLQAVADGRWLELALPVTTGESSVVAAAELWAVGPQGTRPLGWVGGVAEVEQDETLGPTVRLGLFPSRVSLDVAERLEAREVRFHERDGFATLDRRGHVRVRLGSGVREAIGTAPLPSDDDWMGLPGIATVAGPPAAPLVPGPGSHVQGLVHGYCASANPWPIGQFGPDAWVYEDLGQNRSNDQFALDLRARSQAFKSFGVIGHSQGGMAALHLKTFYFSGLDWAGPGRAMQAVGTPFEGTPIAGILAALGAVFGVQCGSNYDLTPEGAAIWLSTIPPAARAKVFTFTTSYTGPGWSGHCSLATSFFLAYPEDGVTEHAAGHFPGANDLGLTYGWCHVDGMRDPAQSLDASRNAAMRTAGAR